LLKWAHQKESGLHTPSSGMGVVGAFHSGYMKCYFRHFGCKSGGFECGTHTVCMGLNARTCCVLIVHEETAPVEVVTECTECDCICRFNVTQVLPILPVECAELRQSGA